MSRKIEKIEMRLWSLKGNVNDGNVLGMLKMKKNVFKITNVYVFYRIFEIIKAVHNLWLKFFGLKASQ